MKYVPNYEFCILKRSALIGILVPGDITDLMLKTALTLYHTILPFHDPTEEGCEKTLGKRRKCWLPSFSPFPTMFSTSSRREIVILATFILLSVNAFKSVMSKILSFGKGLNAITTTDMLSN